MTLKLSNQPAAVGHNHRLQHFMTIKKETNHLTQNNNTHYVPTLLILVNFILNIICYKLLLWVRLIVNL